MIEQLNESKFYFKLKTGEKKMEHKREFERWLEKGLDEFLEPTNRKMKNDETKINYLKYLILSKSDVEK